MFKPLHLVFKALVVWPHLPSQPHYPQPLIIRPLSTLSYRVPPTCPNFSSLWAFVQCCSPAWNTLSGEFPTTLRIKSKPLNLVYMSWAPCVFPSLVLPSLPCPLSSSHIGFLSGSQAGNSSPQGLCTCRSLSLLFTQIYHSSLLLFIYFTSKFHLLRDLS